MKKVSVLLVLALLIFTTKAIAQEFPEPLKTVQKDGVSVPVYDFNSFQELLKMTGETTYVVNFWATWCQPCVAELPSFEKLNSQYAAKNVKVILVSLDMSKQVETKLLPFIKKKNLQSKVVYLNDPDANSWIAKVDQTWSGAIPATVIYNASTRRFYERSFTFEELEDEIKKFIN